MDFTIFVCDEVFNYIRDIITEYDSEMDLFDGWTEHVYSNAYAIYRKEAAYILYKYIDNVSFLKYNACIQNIKDLPATMVSIICDMGLKILEETHERIKEMLESNKSTKEKADEIKRIMFASEILQEVQ